MTYKGYRIANISNDVTFPWYGLFTSDGKQIATGSLPSELKKVINLLKKKRK